MEVSSWENHQFPEIIYKKMDLHGVVPGFFREDPRCSQRSQGLVDVLGALGSGSGLDDLHHGAAAGKLPENHGENEKIHRKTEGKWRLTVRFHPTWMENGRKWRSCHKLSMIFL